MFFSLASGLRTLALNGSIARYVTKGWEHLFDSIDHAHLRATDWLWRYNNKRPNMAIGAITLNKKLALAA